MDFEQWLGQAWAEHGDQATAVASRLEADGLRLAQDDRQLAALARLAHHLLGEHLARYAEGRALMARLSAAVPAGRAARTAARIFDASLALAGGLADLRPALAASERVRVTAHAAVTLCSRDPRRAATLLREAVADAGTEALKDADPACRAIAANGNDIACTMEELPQRDDAERELMVLAARTARDFWARAGTWLEVERAEYRLAVSFTRAGDLTAARRHARRCLDLVREHSAPALERFYGLEALAQVEKAAGHGQAATQAINEMRTLVDQVPEAERAWCELSLSRLAAT